MKSRFDAFTALILLSFFIVIPLSNVTYADDYDYYSDRLSREHREGSDVDEWLERGNASITASPRFEEGVRLTAWASEYDQGNGDEDYEFGIASAIYFFEIPRQAQHIEISVRYRGEAYESNLEDYGPIAGRVWIRNINRELTHRYDDKHADETRYGDTFVLRAKRRSETIKIAPSGHVDNGLLELHIVVEDGQQIDVKSIDVSTYRREQEIRVYPRYVRHYNWQPWHRYTYSYFYDGPFYYGTDLGYFLRWSYPIYDSHYLSIRHSYGNYVHRYYTYHRPYYYRPYSSHVNVNVHVGKPSVRTRTRLNRWSAEHETTRREYSRSRSSKTVRTSERVNVKTRVRTVLDKHRKEQSVLAPQVSRSAVVTRKRKRFDDSTRLNASVQRGRAISPTRQSSTRSGRTIPSLEKRKRYTTNSQPSGSGYKSTPLSNAERRTRIYNRSQSYSRQSRVPSSTRQYNSSSSAKRKRSNDSISVKRRQSTSKSTSAAPRARTSTVKKTRSSSSSASKSSASKKDDDDESKRKSSRSRNTERTKRRRK